MYALNWDYTVSAGMDACRTNSIHGVIDEETDFEQPSVEPIARISVSLPRSLCRQLVEQHHLRQLPS
jgi:hypothetical protein